MLFIWCWLSFNTFLYFYWSVVDLQCCVSFRCTAKWMSYTCIHLFFSHIDHYRVLSGVPCAIQQFFSLCFMYAKPLQLCPTLCKPMDCSLPGSSVHGSLQARILEWVAISYSVLCIVVCICQYQSPNVSLSPVSPDNHKFSISDFCFVNKHFSPSPLNTLYRSDQ